jgi:hypothetical protein
LLDAPDSVLYSRIQQRGTPHPLLGCSLNDAKEGFARWRRSRAKLLELMVARPGGPATLEIRSDTTSLEEAAAIVANQLGLNSAAAVGGIAAAPHRSHEREIDLLPDAERA